jgi:hypothetical protein
MHRMKLEPSSQDLEALGREIKEYGPVTVLKNIGNYVPKRRPENVFVSTDVFVIDAIFRNESEEFAHPSHGVSVSLGGAILSLGECLSSHTGKTAVLALWNLSARGDDQLSFPQIDQLITNDASWTCPAIEPEVELDLLNEICTITWPRPNSFTSSYSFQALHETWAGTAVLMKGYCSELEKTTNCFPIHHTDRPKEPTTQQFSPLEQHSQLAPQLIPQELEGQDLVNFISPEKQEHHQYTLANSIYELSAEPRTTNTYTGPMPRDSTCSTLMISDGSNSQLQRSQSPKDEHVQSIAAFAANDIDNEHQNCGSKSPFDDGDHATGRHDSTPGSPDPTPGSHKKRVCKFRRWLSDLLVNSKTP